MVNCSSRRSYQVLFLAGISFITFLIFHEDILLVKYSPNDLEQMAKSISGESDCTVDWYIKKPFKWIPILDHEESKYFSPLELKSIPKMSLSKRRNRNRNLAEACHLGSRSNGVGSGNVVHGGCFEDSIETFNFFEQRYPVNYKRRLILRNTSTLYNMADVFRLLEGRRLLLKGDSVMNQNYDNLICDLQRNTGYEVNLTVYKRSVRRLAYGTHSKQVATIKNEISEIILHREYRFTLDGLSIKEACNITDVLVMNYGIHWNDMKQYEEDLKLLPDFIREHCDGVQVIVRGTTSQHFPTRDGSGRYPLEPGMNFIRETFNLEKYSDEKISYNYVGCQKIFKRPTTTRDDVALKVFQQSGLKVYDALEMDETKWTEYLSVKRNANVLLFIPFEDITAELHDYHYADCTHFCNGPYFWSIIYHFIAKALGATEQGSANSHKLYNALPWKRQVYKDKPEYDLVEFTWKNTTVYNNK